MENFRKNVDFQLTHNYFQHFQTSIVALNMLFSFTNTIKTNSQTTLSLWNTI